MTTRRSFLALAIGALSATASADKAILEKGKAVVCKEDAVLCPVCKQKTCLSIDAPIVVGNGYREYPDTAQLFDYHIERCENCHAAFFKE